MAEELETRGHVVVKIGGARCGCGRRRRMEAYAGRACMEARARRLAAKGRRTSLFEIAEKRGRDRRRMDAAMLPHLFADRHPPAVRVAALGDLGRAVGASLLVTSS